MRGIFIPAGKLALSWKMTLYSLLRPFVVIIDGTPVRSACLSARFVGRRQRQAAEFTARTMST